MITLKNININFHNQSLIENSNLMIQEGKLTAICGKSGSGKTTIFNILGLISSHRNYQYTMNNQFIDLENEQEKADIRKYQIGYIFQDKNLHEHLSIGENLQLYALLSGNQYIDDQANHLLDLVRLNKSLNENCMNLSGGEKQRLAIACALIKNPDLIIADEPTSALDDDNRDLILSLFQVIARSGKMVIIASHDDAVIEQCDVIYRIDHHQIIEKKKENTSIQRNQPKSIRQITPYFYKWYAKYEFCVTKLEKLFLNYLPVLVMIFCFISYGIQGLKTNQYQKALSDAKDNQVFIDYRNGVSKNAIEQIKQLDGIDKIDLIQQKTVFEYNIDKKLYKKKMKIVSYLPDQIDGDSSKAYCSSHFKEAGEEISVLGRNYQIGGVLSKDLIQSLGEECIYVPYDFDDPEFKSVLVSLSSFEYFDGFARIIHTINSQYTVTYSQAEYLLQGKASKEYSQTLNHFTISLIVAVTIFLCIIQLLAIYERKYEISVLKANGLSFKELVLLTCQMLWISMKRYFIISLLVLIPLSMYFRLVENYRIFDDFKILLFPLFFVNFTYIIPTISMIVSIGSIDAEKLLKF